MTQPDLTQEQLRIVQELVIERACHGVSTDADTELDFMGAVRLGMAAGFTASLSCIDEALKQ